MPELITYSAMLCALVSLETNHNRNQLGPLCIVSHNKLGTEPTTMLHFLYELLEFFAFISCLWDGPQCKRDTSIRNYLE